LKHYFQALEITVPLAQPLGHIFSSKEASGRIGKWATELSLFSINYVAIIAIKSQALADFMADWTPSSQSNSQPPTQVWTLYTDGALDHHSVIDPYAAKLTFKATKNIAKHEGLILGLNKAKALGAQKILVKIDSQVAVGQVEKEYTAQESKSVKYLVTMRALE
jgi:hypothetical protein